jgi:alcohol dehydrogenase, propanol-preferring
MNDSHWPWTRSRGPVTNPGRDEVVVKVAATGMCRSDFQLVDGYFKVPFPLTFLVTPGHEAGRIAGLGADVLASAGLSEGDLVVVDANWGDGSCRRNGGGLHR